MNPTNKTPTPILADAMDILARDIQSGDGVANAAIYEAAGRLRELETELNQAREDLVEMLNETAEIRWQVATRDAMVERLKTQLAAKDAEVAELRSLVRADAALVARMTAERDSLKAANIELQMQLDASCNAEELRQARVENVRFKAALEQFEDCDLHAGNCASIEIASKRIRNIAIEALKGAQ
jgi:chromosome segregation ATPase